MNKQFLKLHIKNIAWAVMLAIFFLIDRYLKSIVIKSESKSIINNLLDFNFVPNYKIAFSLPVSGPWLIILISGIIVAIFYYLFLNYKNLKSFELIGFFGILLGAISNLIDRFKYGFVIDYLDLRWFTIFNLADVLISLSTLSLLVYFLHNNKKTLN